jgi:GNAT superfamily N-acetyltransferase
LLCLTSMRTNSGRDSDTLVFGNEARGLIQRDAKTMHLAPRGHLTSRHYVDEDYRRQGIGSLLYKELEKMLRKQGIVNLLK